MKPEDLDQARADLRATDEEVMTWIRMNKEEWWEMAVYGAVAAKGVRLLAESRASVPNLEE